MKKRTVRNNPCTICGKPGIPGLFKGNGKCEYHWAAGVWGVAWADECERRGKESAKTIDILARSC